MPANSRWRRSRPVNKSARRPLPVPVRRRLKARCVLGLILLLQLLLLGIPLQALICDFSPSSRPFGGDFPHPAVTSGIANRQEPEQRALAEDV